jgi:ketosteroid isomerase-like protein
MSIKYLIGVAIVLASATTWADDHKSNELSPNIIAAKAGYDAFALGDMEAWKATHSSDAVWTVLEGLPYAGTYVGPESVVENVFAKIAVLWPDFKVEPMAFYESGNKVFVHARMTAGGRQTQTVHMATIENGKYVAFTPFDNSGFMMSQANKP